MSITIDNVAPIPLSVKPSQTGTNLAVYYGTTEIATLLDDVFPENTALTNVQVNVTNHAGVPIEVQFGGSTPISVDARGMTSQTMQMPEPNQCNSLNITVWSKSTKHHDPIIRLKRKLGNVTPTCTAG